MTAFSRREFLAFVGGTAATATAASLFPMRSALAAPLPLTFTPVRLPMPLDLYTTNASFLATGLNGTGVPLPASASAELAAYTVFDDLVVPPEFERYVIVQWGDRPFLDPNQYVGYNHDFTAFIPLVGTNEGLLWVNHEYVSYPFSSVAPGTNPGFNTQTPVLQSFQSVIGFPLPTNASGQSIVNREALGEMLYNCGGTVVRIRRTTRNGRFAVVANDSLNRRITGMSGLGANAGRTDGYQTVTSWGTRPHQQGDLNWLLGTGLAASEVFEAVNADGLGSKIIGTFANCSGLVTPWGTVLSAEENFQGSALFFNGVQEGIKANGSQTAYIDGTTGKEFGQLGEKYGWMVEVDPQSRAGAERSRKHTALGRFRHENVGLRAEVGFPLVAYMGDDRRGGGTWKFVSNGIVRTLTAPENSALFEAGALYIAKFNPDGAKDASGMSITGTGEWIPLRLDTECDPIDPDLLVEIQKLNQSTNTSEITGRLNLPARANLAGSGPTVTGGFFNLNVTNKNTVGPSGQTYFNDYRQFPNGTKKKLSDFYSSQGAVLVDAYPAGLLAGGTPCARPEDIEVHPKTKAVFIAMTDGRPSSDGYPDSRIFVNAKYSANINATQQSGGLYKIVEDSADGTGLTFTWSRFQQAGEEGAIDGNGYANLDNLAFDSLLNLWVTTDMSTGLHNAVQDGPTPAQLVMNHSAVGSSASETLVGAYGNNWLFYIPTEGPNAGRQIPFAIGPTRSEMTGPTFVGNTLIISVQHPGEDSPTATAVSPFLSTVQTLNLTGSATFNQARTVPTGSNWPGNTTGSPTGYPRPCTIGIRRKNGGNFL